ncbi:hypothetical protein DQ04_13811010 [Trypanosoma grayi]|uniref:hypothetical protein n=1 Tax=Trypanosoma grayi TaxID=71804 RepID=UPI0004F46C84|nr:hypothetical protein DQ04_13811010 [Trypanosoma grayi]KEG06461.1 hypothetical protein DQ04_13811010 [Trypanosoma grayi]
MHTDCCAWLRASVWCFTCMLGNSAKRREHCSSGAEFTQEQTSSPQQRHGWNRFCYGSCCAYCLFFYLWFSSLSLRGNRTRAACSKPHPRDTHAAAPYRAHALHTARNAAVNIDLF